MTAEAATEDSSKLAAWAALHEAMAATPARYPVSRWRFRHPLADADDPTMDLWPVIRALYMVGACHRVHAGATAPPVSAQPARPRRARKLARGQLPPVGATWPAVRGEVLMLGSALGSHDFEGRAVQHHLDPLRIALARAGLTSSTLLTDVDGDAPQSGNGLLDDSHGALVVLRAAMYHLPPSGRLVLERLPGFTRWHAEITALYPLDQVIEPAAVVEVLEKVYSAAYCLKRWLAARAVKAVIGYCYYGAPGFAAALACRALGIPCFDMQHGSAGARHHCYDWPGLPPGGYNTLPTHFLTWSASEAAAFAAAAAHGGPSAEVVGHSWRLLELALAVGVAAPLPVELRTHHARECDAAAARRAARRAAGIGTVLLTLRAAEDIAWLAPLLADAALPLHFLVRLHPAERRDAVSLAARVSALESARVEVARPSQAAMPVLLRECDVHLTGYSASVLDARAYGLPSLCYAWSSRWFYDTALFPDIAMVPAQADALRAPLLAACAAASTRASLPATPSLDEVGTRLAGIIRAPTAPTRGWLRRLAHRVSGAPS